MSPCPSGDFRERVVLPMDAGLAPGEAATHFRIGIRTISRWLARLRRRSWERIVAAIDQTLPTITAPDARAFFADAGCLLP